MADRILDAARRGDDAELARIAADLCMCGHARSSHAFEAGRCMLCHECIVFDSGEQYDGDDKPAETVERPCPGPVCNGAVRVFRYVGLHTLDDGQEYHAYSCTGCETAPPGKVHSGLDIYDEDGKLLEQRLSGD